MVHKGKIVGFQGSWDSGLGYLTIKDSKTHELKSVPCENAPTVRALEAAFGNVVGNAHDVRVKGGHIGKEIFWTYDEMGLVLGGFMPVKMASEEVKRLYKNMRRSQ